MLEILFSAVCFGLTAGLSPGPLLTLVVTETLHHGKIAGMRVALAPVLTDGPIILVSLFLLSQMTNSNRILGAISLLGGTFATFLAIESLRTKGITISIQGEPPHSLKKGVLVNFLSPHPYIFWMSVGGPLILHAQQVNKLGGILFIGTFLAGLVGSKLALAVVVARSRTFLRGAVYLWTVRVLGIALLVFATLFFQDALQRFELI